MSALDDIEAATAALNALTAQEAAEKARIDAAVAAALAAVQAPARTVYVDAVAGLDINPGTSPPAAVQTLQKAAALMSAGQYGIVVLCSDVTLTSLLFCQGPLQIQGDTTQADASNTGTKRKVTIAPPALTQTGAGVTAIGTGYGRYLSFYGVDVATGPLATGSGVITVTGKLLFVNTVLTFDPGMTSPLIYGTAGADVIFLNATLPASYAGRLFANVPASANPNGPLLRTNLNTA